MFFLIALPAGFVISAVLTYLWIIIGLRRGVLDIPNERSSHTLPVPRGGGVSIIFSFLVFLAIYQGMADSPIDNSIWKSLFFGGAIIGAVGLIDDFGHVPARWRFFIHLFAAFLSLSFLSALPDITVFRFSLDLDAFGYVFFAIFLVWFVNLFNFMDGIDGIVGVETITALGSAALISFTQDQTSWLTLLAYLAACVAGFLVWNWAPAKVFMGDACSGFLGFTLGLLVIVTSAEGVINLWTWLTLFGVFLVDATATLLRRMVRKEKWYEAHRSHAYQILSRHYDSHRNVTLGVLTINIAWLLPLGLLAAVYPYWGPLICSFALLPLLVLAYSVGAGRQEAPS